MLKVFLLIFALGLAAGSFINALVWRLHEQSKELKATSKKLKVKKPSAFSLQPSANDLSILKGRSMCTYCHQHIAWYDLIPVLSWVSLRGKCRYCKKPISIVYPAVEILTAVTFVVSFQNWSLDTTMSKVLLLLWLCQIVLLVALAVYDLKWFLLPNKLIYPLLAGGGAYTLGRALESSSPEPVVTATAGFFIVGGLFWLIFQISKGKWLGGGDVKLAAYMGLLLGIQKAFLAIFLASYLALIIFGILVLLKLKSRRDLLPFGPFLILASFISLFWSDYFINLYLRLNGL